MCYLNGEKRHPLTFFYLWSKATIFQLPVTTYIDVKNNNYHPQSSLSLLLGISLSHWIGIYIGLAKFVQVQEQKKSTSTY